MAMDIAAFFKTMSAVFNALLTVCCNSWVNECFEHWSNCEESKRKLEQELRMLRALLRETEGINETMQECLQELRNALDDGDRFLKDHATVPSSCPPCARIELGRGAKNLVQTIKQRFQDYNMCGQFASQGARLSEIGPSPLDSRMPNESAPVTPEQGHPVASVDGVMVKPEVVINKESPSSLGRNFDKLQDTDNPEVEHAHDLKVVSNQELLLANERDISIDTGMKVSEKSVPEQGHGSIEIGREYLQRSMPQHVQGPVQVNAEYVERSAPEQGHGSIEVSMEYLEKGVPEQGQGSVTIEASTSFSERDAPQQGPGLDETSAQHKD